MAATATTAAPAWTSRSRLPVHAGVGAAGFGSRTFECARLQSAIQQFATRKSPGHRPGLFDLTGGRAGRQAAAVRVRRRLGPAAMGAMVVLVTVGCGPAAPAPISDPRDILAAAVEHLDAAKSVHVRAAIDGSVVLGALGVLPAGAGGLGGLGGGGGALSLTGTSFEGDADLTGGRAAVRFAVPALLGLTGEIRQLVDATYVSSTLTSKGWHRLDAASGLPLDLSHPTAWLGALTAWLDGPATVPTRRDDAGCASGSCYVVRLVLGAGELRAIASGGPGPIASLADATITADLSIDKRSLTLTEASLSVDLGAGGSIHLGLTFSAWDAAVTVDPPPADQVVPGPLLP